jgi:hypothetical protein
MSESGVYKNYFKKEQTVQVDLKTLPARTEW